MEGNVVKNHLVSTIRQRLAEQDLFISEESLEFTAERYAWMVMDDPELSISELLDHDIVIIKKILDEFARTPKAG